MGWDSGDRYALDVLGEILGGSGAISRIAGRLRTAEGLVYRASARIDPGELWVGDFQIFFDTRGSQVARAVELSLEELHRIRTEPVHPTELEVAKQTLLGKLRLSFDTAEETAGTASRERDPEPAPRLLGPIPERYRRHDCQRCLEGGQGPS